MSKYIEIDTALLKTVATGGLSAKALWKRIMQQPSIEIDLADDGTLSVEVEDATNVKRVLVEDGESGDLYYADGRPQGEWIEHKWIEYNEEFMFEMPMHNYECSKCHSILHEVRETNYCPSCGARMKGADDERQTKDGR